MFVSHMLRFASRDSVEKERSIVRALKLPARSIGEHILKQNIVVNLLSIGRFCKYRDFDKRIILKKNGQRTGAY